MDRAKRYCVVVSILLVFFLGNIISHSVMIEEFLAQSKRFNIILPNKNFTNLFAPSFIKPLLADYLWIKIASKLIDVNKVTLESAGDLYQYMLLLSELDPYFYMPYIVGGTFLADVKFEYSKEIMKRGIKFLPEKWQLNFLLGYYYFFKYNNKDEGYLYFKNCLSLKETPQDIKNLIPLLTLKFTSESERLQKLNELKKGVKDQNILKIIEKIERSIKKDG